MLKERYKRFYQDSGLLNIRDYPNQTSEKRELLEFYFPQKFGEKGEQRLSEYSASQIGKLFDQLNKYAEKILKE